MYGRYHSFHLSHSNVTIVLIRWMFGYWRCQITSARTTPLICLVVVWFSTSVLIIDLTAIGCMDYLRDMGNDNAFTTQHELQIQVIVVSIVNNHVQVLVNVYFLFNVGCYATCAQLSLLPLLQPLLGVSSRINIFGVSGYSGAGVNPSPYNDPQVLKDNVVPYKQVHHIHEV